MNPNDATVNYAYDDIFGKKKKLSEKTSRS